MLIFALLDLAVDDLHRQIRILHHRTPVDRLHLAGARFGGVFLAHHALADGRHLRTVVGIDDRGDNVAAEGRTNLVEQVLIICLGLGIGVVADHELRTVGRQTAVQRRRHARREITAHGRRTEQGDLRLLPAGSGRTAPPYGAACGTARRSRRRPPRPCRRRIWPAPSRCRRRRAPSTTASSLTPSSSASSRPLVSNSRLTSATAPFSSSI